MCSLRFYESSLDLLFQGRRLSKRDVPLPSWEVLEDSEENSTALMHWLYNYRVYFQDGMTVQHQEQAIYFVKRVDQILDSPWIVCIHVVDVCKQEDRKIFFKVHEFLPAPVHPSP